MAQEPDRGDFLRLVGGRILWWYRDQLLQLEGTTWGPANPHITLQTLMTADLLSPEEIKRLEDSGVVLPTPSPSSS
jgi:hypothetical protein